MQWIKCTGSKATFNQAAVPSRQNRLVTPEGGKLVQRNSPGNEVVNGQDFLGKEHLTSCSVLKLKLHRRFPHSRTIILTECSANCISAQCQMSLKTEKVDLNTEYKVREPSISVCGIWHPVAAASARWPRSCDRHSVGHVTSSCHLLPEGFKWSRAALSSPCRSIVSIVGARAACFCIPVSFYYTFSSAYVFF